MEQSTEENIKQHIIPWAAIVAVALFLGLWLSGQDISARAAQAFPSSAQWSESLPTLSIEWGDTGRKLVESGAIDPEKFEQLYEERGGLSTEERALLYEDSGAVVVTKENAGVFLNLLWAVGIANENPILFDPDEMMNPVYANAGSPASGFASTGGWTLAHGSAMNHYGKHSIISLTPHQQKLVDDVSRNIYRPCCNNSTHFPDCNHGMAMLGLLEILASQGASEEEMYSAALAVNSLWFLDAYDTIGAYANEKGLLLSPQEMLSAYYSSASGFAKVAEQVSTLRQGGSSCSA